MNKNIGKYFVFLLGFLAAFPPMATDMYLPALPMLQNLWNESMSSVNLTLAAFFTAFCISLLIYGPVSDQFGRRRPLLNGIGLYIAASLSCAFAANVEQMVIFRIFQAVGAASASGLAVAISKDVYKGNERQRILAIVNVIMAIAPMIGPTVGSLILGIGSWHWIFAVQATLGFIGWVGVFRMPETMSKESGRKAIETAGAYLELIKNKRYILLTILFSIIVIPHFSFIAVSSNIFINQFGFSEHQFGLFFALNAGAIMAGSFLCSRLSKIVDSKHIITASLIGIAAGGLCMVIGVFPGPWRLSIPMSVCSFSYGLNRPPVINMILEQVKRFAGAASSLILFSQFLTAAFAMRFISMDWYDPITVLGLSAVITGTFVLLLWQFALRKISVNPLIHENE